MTPAARIAASIECLDAIFGGQAAEHCLTSWARAHRFAGSKDRAAIRDLVFTALRRRDSLAWLGGGLTGRSVMIGHCRDTGLVVGDVFSGDGYAPDPLTPEETNAGALLTDAPWSVRHDVPEWLESDLREVLGADADRICTSWRDRAPIFLRVALSRTSLEEAMRLLAADEVEAKEAPDAATALVVSSGSNRIRNSAAYQDGLVELQDASGQAAILSLATANTPSRVLDYCAGGGGKSLAMADLWPSARISAHDIDPARMRDLPERAKRAKAKIKLVPPGGLGGEYDLVLCDVPCSGSGTWRRQPDAKWKLTKSRLDALAKVQREILQDACEHVGESGRLAYMTCSVLRSENEGTVSSFLAEHPDWQLEEQRRFDQIDGGDHFFLATLKRK